MDFDKPKVYGDTSITDGLVLFDTRFSDTYVLNYVAARKLRNLNSNLRQIRFLQILYPTNLCWDADTK